MKKLFFLLSLVFALQSESHNSVTNLGIIQDLKSDETFNYPDYYQVKEDPRLQNINLLVFLHTQVKFPYPKIPYNRDSQFGTWLRDIDGSCLNTRGKVLVRDSDSTVNYSANGCTVASGRWDDPYTARSFRLAKDIQIDHFVPLKNTYMTGGFEWDQAKRCLYANYMGNEFHLLSVDGPENMHKSDSAPNQYMPPNQKYACQYLKQWLEVKTIWALRITPREATALLEKVKTNHCDETAFVIPNQFIQEQRRFMAENANLCHLN